MSAVIYSLRPFQSAVQQAARCGIPRETAVHAVAREQRAGNTGQTVAWQLRTRAMHGNAPTGPEAA